MKYGFIMFFVLVLFLFPCASAQLFDWDYEQDEEDVEDISEILGYEEGTVKISGGLSRFGDRFPSGMYIETGEDLERIEIQGESFEGLASRLPSTFSLDGDGEIVSAHLTVGEEGGTYRDIQIWR